MALLRIILHEGRKRMLVSVIERKITSCCSPMPVVSQAGIPAQQLWPTGSPGNGAELQRDARETWS